MKKILVIMFLLIASIAYGEMKFSPSSTVVPRLTIVDSSTSVLSSLTLKNNDGTGLGGSKILFTNYLDAAQSTISNYPNGGQDLAIWNVTNTNSTALTIATNIVWNMISTGNFSISSNDGGGSAVQANAFKVKGASGHWSANGTVATLSSCGTGSPTITGNGVAGIVNIDTGSPTACTVTFATTHTNVPSCVVVNRGVAGYAYISAQSATAFTVTTSAAWTATNGFNYHCIGLNE
jgi:hypothetical protein